MADFFVAGMLEIRYSVKPPSIPGSSKKKEEPVKRMSAVSSINTRAGPFQFSLPPAHTYLSSLGLDVGVHHFGSLLGVPFAVPRSICCCAFTGQDFVYYFHGNPRSLGSPRERKQ